MSHMAKMWVWTWFKKLDWVEVTTGWSVQFGSILSCVHLQQCTDSFWESFVSTEEANSKESAVFEPFHTCCSSLWLNHKLWSGLCSLFTSWKVFITLSVTLRVVVSICICIHSATLNVSEAHHTHWHLLCSVTLVNVYMCRLLDRYRYGLGNVFCLERPNRKVFNSKPLLPISENLLI